jgi:hypothetical protein
MDFATADSSFRQYLADFTRNAPRHATDAALSPADIPATPAEWHLARVLCKDWGSLVASYGDVWDVPWSVAHHAWDCTAEAAGTVKLMNEYDQELADLQRREVEARNAGDEAAVAMAIEEQRKLVETARKAFAQ